MKTILKSAVAATAVAATALALVVPLSAATPPSLVVGDPPTGEANGLVATTAPATVIDRSRPANATGNLTTATFGWTSAACASVVKIKVFHPAGSTLTMTGERGPFNSGGELGHNNHAVTLAPPLAIQQGDLIGIGVVASCGSPLVDIGFPTPGFVLYHGDVTGSVSLLNPPGYGTSLLALGATGVTTQYTALVVPGVGSTPGAFGAQFKTSLQIVASPYGGDLSGKLVFHPIGVSGSVSDPSMGLQLGAGRAVSYGDIVATMGQTGLGSLDVVLDASSPAPVVYARVFNDAGAAGTSGLGEPAIDVAQSAYFPGSLVMGFGCTGILSAPIDPAHLRINLGMRSLDADVTIGFTLKDVTGATRATAQQGLSPNEFLQVKAEDVFGGTAPGANDYIQVSVSGGAAIVYGATTDNTTNDPSVQFVTSIGCIA